VPHVSRPSQAAPFWHPFFDPQCDGSGAQTLGELPPLGELPGIRLAPRESEDGLVTLFSAMS